MNHRVGKYKREGRGRGLRGQTGKKEKTKNPAKAGKTDLRRKHADRLSKGKQLWPLP